jgi:hypothetical protein
MLERAATGNAKANEKNESKSISDTTTEPSSKPPASLTTDQTDRTHSDTPRWNFDAASIMSWNPFKVDFQVNYHQDLLFYLVIDAPIDILKVCLNLIGIALLVIMTFVRIAINSLNAKNKFRNVGPQRNIRWYV